MSPRKKPAPALPVRESCFLHGDYVGGVCPGCRRARRLAEPRLRTQSDEVQELRGALIAMLWNVVGGDTDESCAGDCEEKGGNRTNPEWGTPYPACAAVRALGWAEHFDARSFEMRASR